MASLEDLFGRPTFTRRDPPAEFWQYQTDTCVLDLFLYDDGTGAYEVTHLEFRETGRKAEDRENCLRAIITRMTAAGAG